MPISLNSDGSSDVTVHIPANWTQEFLAALESSVWGCTFLGGDPLASALLDLAILKDHQGHVMIGTPKLQRNYTGSYWFFESAPDEWTDHTNGGARTHVPKFC